MLYVVNIGMYEFSFFDRDVALNFAETAVTFCSDSRNGFGEPEVNIEIKRIKGEE